jgi:high-affinity nickel-transport protein
MPDLPTSGSERVAAMTRQSFATITRQERKRVITMFGVIAGLHGLGFFVFFACVVPSHYKGLGIGVSILAYILGLRHAFDADHISAIDNTIRKLLSDRQDTGQPRPCRSSPEVASRERSKDCR